MLEISLGVGVRKQRLSDQAMRPSSEATTDPRSSHAKLPQKARLNALLLQYPSRTVELEAKHETSTSMRQNWTTSGN